MNRLRQILLFVAAMCAICAQGAGVVPVESADTVIVDTFVCKGVVYEFGGEPISETGTYVKTYKSSVGTDSTVVLYLSVEDCASFSNVDESEEKAMKSNLNCDKVISPRSSFGPGSEERNPVWVIENIEKYNNVVSIYDRWGKLLYQKRNYSNSDGWDGTFRGSELPSNDYWYAISLDDLGRICYGHFSYKKDR